MMRGCAPSGSTSGSTSGSRAYDQLPTVTDPQDAGCTIEYKANALGIETILRDCGRVVDWNATVANLDYVFQQLVLLKRYRESDGDRVDVIDVMTDRATPRPGCATSWASTTSRSSVGTSCAPPRSTRRSPTTTRSCSTTTSSTCPTRACKLAVFGDPFFDDQLSAFRRPLAPRRTSRAAPAASGSSTGPTLRSVLAKSFRRSQSPDAATNDLYKCVITPNVTEYNLRSWKWTTLVDRPHRHLVIGNFSDGAAVLGGLAAPATWSRKQQFSTKAGGLRAARLYPYHNAVLPNHQRQRGIPRGVRGARYVFNFEPVEVVAGSWRGVLEVTDENAAEALRTIKGIVTEVPPTSSPT